MFSKQLNEKLDKYHLLKQPFYKAWNEGKLTREVIKDYAEQYYQHVKAFPRYISATHSLCEDIKKRKILLENLQDEENKDADHPKLWKNFALAMGADLAYIGTSFIATKESDADDNYKKMLIDSSAKDIVYTNYFSGVHGNYLSPSVEKAGMDPSNLPEAEKTKMNCNSGGNASAKGWKDIYGSGQGINAIKKTTSVDELVRKISIEFKEAQ